VKHPAANLLELEHQRIRISPGECIRIDFRNQQVGCRQIAVLQVIVVADRSRGLAVG
jgi:hypothetical protein